MAFRLGQVSRPNIMLRFLKIARQDVHRFPTARPHYGCCVVAHAQQILGRPDAKGVTAERVNGFGVQPLSPGGRLDHLLDRRRAEIAIDRFALIDGAEQPVDHGAAPVEPILDEVGCAT